MRLSKDITGPPLAELAAGHNNNLNLIRMMLALSVLVSHSAPLAEGAHTVEPLQNTLHFSLGELAVYGFFFISGLLITQSIFRHQHLTSYLRARAMRIFPGLAVVLFLTLLVLGPSATTLSLPNYFANHSTWTYLPANLLLFRPQYELPGVFHSNPYVAAINGSLWTLFYEFACYLILAAIWALGGLSSVVRIRATAAAVAAAIAVTYVIGHLTGVGRLMYFSVFGFCFACGAAAHFLRDHIRLNRILALGLVVGFAGIQSTVPCIYFFCPAFFYALLTFGYLPASKLGLYRNLGDFSYGTYIYAFPVTQTLAWLMPGITPVRLCMLSLAATLPFAILSWFLVEQPALQLDLHLRKRFAREWMR